MDGYSIAVLTVSDTASSGSREDLSGPLAAELMSNAGYSISSYEVLPDDPDAVAARLISWADSGSVDLILTTGGTGFSPRDMTPEATKAVYDREVPGIPEMLRARSAETVPTAWLSRGTAGIRGSTLIVNLPGSAKAVRECIGILLPVLHHSLEVLGGDSGRCGT